MRAIDTLRTICLLYFPIGKMRYYNCAELDPNFLPRVESEWHVSQNFQPIFMIC